MAEPTIEEAREEHVEAIAAIYSEAAQTSVATFDAEGRPAGWWLEAVRTVDPGAGRMLLVALDGGGRVAGYAKSGEYKPKHAYRTTCETSIYVASEARGRGVGGALYDALLVRLDRSPLRLAVGGVAEPNAASTRLHLSRGFRAVGTFHAVGTKHGAARDVTWFERRLARPAIVGELESAPSLEAAAAAIERELGGVEVSFDGAPGGDGALITPVFDSSSGTRLGAVAVTGRPFGVGDELLLEWCAEPLARLLAAARAGAR